MKTQDKGIVKADRKTIVSARVLKKSDHKSTRLRLNTPSPNPHIKNIHYVTIYVNIVVSHYLICSPHVTFMKFCEVLTVSVCVHTHTSVDT